MAKIVISYNIPIPKAQDHEVRFSSCKRYPFEEMKRGASFFVKDRTSHQLAAAALCWSRRNGGGYNQIYSKTKSQRSADLENKMIE